MIKTHIPARPRNKKIVPTGGASISPSISSAVGSSHTHNNKSLLDLINQGNIDVLSKLFVDESDNLYTTQNFYSQQSVSAYGIGSGGSGGGGDISKLPSWAGYTPAMVDYYVSAGLLVPFYNDMQSRVGAIEAGGGGGGSTVTWGTESGGYIPLTVEGVSKSVALSTHTHSQYALSTHNHSGVYEPAFTKNTAFNKNFGTTSTTVARGNHTHSGVYEPVFSKNTAFNKAFGTTSGTVAEGNDSRIVNGQTAYSWGNHASAGYALNTALTAHINKVDNPHSVTKAQVGLGNVLNVASYSKTESDTNLTSAIDNIEIGSRNYFMDISRNSYQGNSIIPVDGFYIANVGSYGGVIFNKARIEEGIEYVLSFEYKTTDNPGWYTMANPGSATGGVVPGTDVTLNLIQDGVLRKKVIRFTAPTTREISIGLLRIGNSGTVYYKENSIKLEKGTIATDWTPAPEDVQAEIDNIEIGGRNLILNSLNRIGFISNIPATFPIQDQAVSGENYRRFRRTYPEGITSTEINTFTAEFFTPKKSGYYTYSTYFRPNGFDVELRLLFSSTYGNHILCKANEWTQISVTAYIEVGVATRLGGVWGEMPPEAVQWIDYNRVSVASGNKSMDWTEAPEDTQAKIDSKLSLTGGTLTGNLTSPTITASTSVTTPKVIFAAAGWSLEQVGTELQYKYNGVVKQRMLSNGSIVATGEVTAFVAAT